MSEINEQIRHMLVDVGSPANIGTTIRTVDVLTGLPLIMFDPRDVFTQEAEEIYRISTGLSKQRPPEFVPDLEDYLSSHEGRIIAMVLDSNAVPITEFSFSDRDLVLYGHENYGLDPSLNTRLPRTLMSYVTHKVYIPMLGTSWEVHRADKEPKLLNPNLNVGATVSAVAAIANYQFKLI